MTPITPNKYYSLKEIFESEFFPWINNERTLASWVQRDIDMGEKSILKAVKVGDGGGTRYMIKGENIIKFRTAFDEGGVLY